LLEIGELLALNDRAEELIEKPLLDAGVELGGGAPELPVGPAPAELPGGLEPPPPITLPKSALVPPFAVPPIPPIAPPKPEIPPAVIPPIGCPPFPPSEPWGGLLEAMEESDDDRDDEREDDRDDEREDDRDDD
jgi:hypothetical protein